MPKKEGATYWQQIVRITIFYSATYPHDLKVVISIFI